MCPSLPKPSTQLAHTSCCAVDHRFAALSTCCELHLLPRPSGRRYQNQCKLLRRRVSIRLLFDWFYPKNVRFWNPIIRLRRPVGLLLRLTIQSIGWRYILPPFHNTCHFGFSRYISFIIYIYIYVCVHVKRNVSRKVKIERTVASRDRLVKRIQEDESWSILTCWWNELAYYYV